MPRVDFPEILGIGAVYFLLLYYLIRSLCNQPSFPGPGNSLSLSPVAAVLCPHGFPNYEIVLPVIQTTQLKPFLVL